MGNAYWDVFLSKNVSDLVIESFRNVRDLKVRPLHAGFVEDFAGILPALYCSLGNR